ncbi:farnesyl diphosphate synthase 2-like [Bidens hawaiensis]|uniref:farnesyl diphosphate synthase 2-like n=1 Tax=Bidens hawaiensis TaxID=980011 RepID=UPI0040491879
MAFFNRVVCNLSSKWASWDASSQLKPTSVGPFVPGKFVVPCHTRSNYSTLSTERSNDLKSKFMQVYDSIKFDLLHDPSFEFDDDSRQWVERMIDYNVPGGKMIRGLAVVDSYQLLNTEKLTDDGIFLSSVLGWCIEWLQAYLLVHDDIMDDSHTRRGHPCWFRLPEVGMIAVNDAVVLRSHIHRILKKHFSGKAYYVNLLNIFNEAEFQTVSGQMIDATTKLAGEKNLSKYSISTYRRIVQFKTSYYSLYLPVACALLMLGENLDDHVDMKDILVEIGIYSQMQNDYLDTFGDPNVVSQTGSDIENSTCSWLVAKALELANEEQTKILCENYGTKDPAKVAKVIELYHTLNLQRVYEDYENKTREELIKSIEALPSKPIQQVLKSLLGKLYRMTH